MRFWDYGNAFLLEASRAGANVRDPNETIENRFKYPSYMQDVMGDIFSLGFGPYRWICASSSIEDLHETDKVAADCIRQILATPNCNKKN